MVAADGVVEPLGARKRAEEQEHEREGKALAARERDGREVPVFAVERGDLAPVSNGDAVPLELVDQVVGHRLAEVGAAVEEGDERAATGEPDRGLAGGVAAADDRDTRTGAELGLGRPGGVEDGQSLEFGQAVDREPPVLGARREQYGARCDLPVVLEPDEMPAVPRFERERAVRRRGARVELARLGDRAARELGAADPRGKAEVVLDPSGRPGLAAERGALDDERVEPFGGAVDRGGEACRAGRRRSAGRPPREARARARSRERAAPGRRLDRAALLRRAVARAATRRRRAGVVSCQVYGSRFARANSSIRIVGSEPCGPTISRPIPCTLCSASRREMNVERSRSLSGPSSFRSERSAARSTAMYRSGSVTSALTKTVCPDRRFSSPRKPEGPCLTSSFPAASTIATSPSRIAMNGYVRSPTRYSSSPTGAERSSPISARAASCDGESSGLAGVDTFVPP